MLNAEGKVIYMSQRTATLIVSVMPLAQVMVVIWPFVRAPLLKAQ